MAKFILTTLGFFLIINLGHAQLGIGTNNFDLNADSSTYPAYKTLAIVPLWSKRIKEWHGRDDYGLILKDSVLVTNQNFALELNNGLEITESIGKLLNLSEPNRVITMTADLIYLMNLSNGQVDTLGENNGIIRTPIQIENETVIHPGRRGLIAYSVFSNKEIWKVRQDFRLVWDVLLQESTGLVSSRTYYQASIDSISHAISKIGFNKEILDPIITNSRVKQLFTFGESLIVVCENRVISIDLKEWAVNWIQELNFSQRFVLSAGKFISPNFSISIERGELSKISSLGWSGQSINTWNNWLILNFDDGEVTRQFLVSRDRKRTFMLDYMAADFQPCLMEGFGDRTVLDFVSSEGRYIAAICKCDNGYFLYGFDFPELPEE